MGAPPLARHTAPDTLNIEGSTLFTVRKPAQSNFRPDMVHGLLLLIATFHTGFSCTTIPVSDC